MSKIQAVLIALCLLASAAGFLGARRCERASWAHHDAVYGTGQGPLARGASADAHKKELDRLNLLTNVLTLGSTLTFAAALCVLGWGARAGFVAVSCLFGGLVLFGIMFFEAMSLMDLSVADQRERLLWPQLLGVASFGALLACGALAALRMRSWKRIGGLALSALILCLLIREAMGEA